MSQTNASDHVRLDGFSLSLGRMFYGLLLALCVGMFGASLTYKFVQGTSSCYSIYNEAWMATGNWCLDWVQALQDIGLSAVAFEGYFFILRILAATPFFVVSLLLIRRQGKELRVLLFASLLLVIGITGTWFNPFWIWAEGWFDLYAPYPVLDFLIPLLTYFLMGGSVLFVSLFPDGRFFPRWSRWFTAVGLLLLFGNNFFPETVLAWDNWPFPLSTLVPLTLIFLGISVIVIRYRNQDDAVQRQQIKWVTFGFLLIGLNFLLDFSVFNIYPALTGNDLITSGHRAVLWEIFQDTFSHLSQFVLGICFGLAVFRNRLWDIDPILNRTLVFVSLSALIIAIYLAIVGGLGFLFQVQSNALSGLIAAAIIAVVFQPLRERLQKGVSRLLYGHRDDPAAVLTQLAQKIQTADSPSNILPNLAQTIAQTLKIPYVAIQLPGSDNQFYSAAVWGNPVEQIETISLTYQNDISGHLVVGQRGPDESFNRDELALLKTIAALTSLTVRAVQLSTELRRSRKRIVTAVEDERRRLRRDLHDGLGPQLASQALGLEAVEQLMNSNPEKVKELLASLQTQAQEAIIDVRRLVYELRPPALDDLGLVGALKQSAKRLENGNLQFTFDVPETLPDLPAAVETAVYRITQEAMTNIVRHSQATNGTIHLSSSDNQLLLEICDDGLGLSGAHQGVGLHSMRERAAELNGKCIIDSRSEGGTRIQARLPLEGNDD